MVHLMGCCVAGYVLYPASSHRETIEDRVVEEMNCSTTLIIRFINMLEVRKQNAYDVWSLF